MSEQYLVPNPTNKASETETRSMEQARFDVRKIFADYSATPPPDFKPQTATVLYPYLGEGEPQEPPRYVVDQFIDKGGYSSVSRAYDLRLGRFVAIKSSEIRPDKLESIDDVKTKVLSEASKHEALSSRYVVPVYDLVTYKDPAKLMREYKVGMVMAYQDKQERPTLKDYIETHGVITPQETAVICRGIADVLHATHNAGIVHRDLKPAQFFLNLKDLKLVRVTDFGISKLYSELLKEPDTDTIVGTPAYLSPERSMGKPATLVSETYSFAIMTYEMITGHRPFSADSPGDLLIKIVKNDGVTPQMAESLPSSTRSIFNTAFRKEPSNRYQTPREFVEALVPTLVSAQV